MAHVDKVGFDGDPNIGLYAVATDKFVLIGRGLSLANLKKLEKIFGVPIIEISIYNTNLIGIFICANSNNILVPEVIYKEELIELKNKTKGLANVHIVKTEFNALGNNILANDKTAIFNDELPSEKIKEIANKYLNVEKVKVGLKNDLHILPGTAAVITNKGGIFPPDLSESETKKVENFLGFEIGLGTVNMGGKMLGSGIVANSNGFIIGTNSSGYEIGRVEESLGFMK